MLKAVKAIYENGQIIWNETPPVNERTEIIVIFLDKKETLTKINHDKVGSMGIHFGSLTGKVAIPDDFNEPLDDPIS